MSSPQTPAVCPADAGWDAPAGTFDGSGFRRPAKGERPGQHREPCMCKVCRKARDEAAQQERERLAQRLVCARCGGDLWLTHDGPADAHHSAILAEPSECRGGTCDPLSGWQCEAHR